MVKKSYLKVFKTVGTRSFVVTIRIDFYYLNNIKIL